jgi:hypothetical protein
VPNASESERQHLPGGGSKVHVSWQPEHMHLVTESPDGGDPDADAAAEQSDQNNEGEKS